MLENTYVVNQISGGSRPTFFNIFQSTYQGYL